MAEEEDLDAYSEDGNGDEEKEESQQEMAREVEEVNFMDNKERYENANKEEEKDKDDGNGRIERLEERMQILEKRINEKTRDNKLLSLKNMVNGIIDERMVLEKGMQEKGDENIIQILEEAVQNVCMVVDVVMKKVVMATISSMGKIKKQQKKKALGDSEDLASKMELNAIVNNTIEDLMKAWKLIKDT